MNTYTHTTRLTEDEKTKLLTIKKQLQNEIGKQISINETIKILINKKEIKNDKKES